QNFLVDKNIQRKIISSIESINELDEIVEIGPGRGALTEHLIGLDKQISVIEYDRDLAVFWRSRSLEKFRIIESDFLKIDFTAQFDRSKKRAFIGNIPYNITSPILFKLMENPDYYEQIIIMMQKEVAERLLANAGSKTYGILSVLCGLQFSIEKLFDVPRTVFQPRPKVESTVLRLNGKAIDSRLQNYVLFKEIVKRSFNQRRKMLRVSLREYISDYKGVLDLTRRPEQLSIAEFIELSNALNRL
ncbi:MAG: ribosomal RNA small subunit methyltransferase A, partial [Calditrichaeota bacterium]|nr:ribosomal RNA small subunit methyltransferase A [Calditrichota bacterium]